MPATRKRNDASRESLIGCPQHGKFGGPRKANAGATKRLSAASPAHFFFALAGAGRMTKWMFTGFASRR